jgi:signal transduction histidine kinase
MELLSSSSLELLSLFDSHVHAVIALERESREVVYANSIAKELFISQLLGLNGDSLISPTRILGTSEVWFHSNQTFSINRLDCKRFNEQVIFIIPKENEPGTKAITTAELAASLVAHLFRSPLTALLGLAEMVGQANETNRDKLAMALTDGLKRISSFVDDLDTFNSTIKPDIQTINLGALLQSLIYDLPAQQRQLIQFKTAPGILEIDTDARLLKEICLELINNAFEFGVDSLSPLLIELRSDAQIRISNAGQLSKDVESKLFIPFFTTKAQNWGLGLSSAVKKAEAIGAMLRLTNNSRIDGIVFEISFLK